ncbi:MAG: ABC transporter permease subunit [Defluviitaleaceae bacterium]|nr:ABC transporter permease subunit [Defluviitaleaceae bacterium]MCL2239363.1 ABC transporter permease subunit [Defluviitaleaceae bacterium]
MKRWFGSLIGMLFGERVSKISLMEEEQVQSPVKTIIREFFRRKLTIIGLVAFFTMLLASTIFPFFYPMDLRETDTAQVNQRPSLNMMRVPRSIRGELDMVASGTGFGVGVTRDYRVHAWGTVSTIAQPLLSPPQPGRPISHICAGPYHALVVTEDGHLYSWGNESPTFAINDVPPAIQGSVLTAAAGMRMTVAITDDHRLHSWGGIDANRRQLAAIGRVNAIPDIPVQVESSERTFGVLTECGQIHVLLQIAEDISYVPEAIQGRVVDFAMTVDNGAAVLDDGTVVIWGVPTHFEALAVPEHIQGRVVSIGAGRGHFTALLNDGSVVSWGENRNGRTNAPNITNAVAIAINGDHNYALFADGTVATWGFRGFPLGSDGVGRCVFTRLWHGGRYSLLIGMMAVVVQGIIGIILGGFAGFYGKGVDMFIMRFGEVVGSLPFLPIAIIIQFRFRHELTPVQGMVFLMAVLGVLSWPPLMRLVRAQIMQVKEGEYVLAARALGVRQFKIIFRHIMPNVASAAIVALTLALASSMLTETTLSFIGFGVSEPYPTWGNMISGSNNSIVLRYQWWRWLFPAVSLVTVALSINLIGDGLREATDPKAQGR